MAWWFHSPAQPVIRGPWGDSSILSDPDTPKLTIRFRSPHMIPHPFAGFGPARITNAHTEPLGDDFITWFVILLINFHAMFFNEGLQQLIHQFHDRDITMNFKWPVFFNGIERVVPDVASHDT